MPSTGDDTQRVSKAHPDTNSSQRLVHCKSRRGWLGNSDERALCNRHTTVCGARTDVRHQRVEWRGDKNETRHLTFNGQPPRFFVYYRGSSLRPTSSASKFRIVLNTMK